VSFIFFLQSLQDKLSALNDAGFQRQDGVSVTVKNVLQLSVIAAVVSVSVCVCVSVCV